MELKKRKSKKCKVCDCVPELGSETKLNGEAIVSITDQGYFYMECQESSLALSDKGVSELRTIIDKWYEAKQRK